MYQQGTKDVSPEYQPGNNQKNIYSNPGDKYRIKFKVGSTVFLNNAEEAKFNTILLELGNSNSVSLEGFASSDGDKEANFELSQKRVQKIAKLIRARYPNIIINYSACGEVEGDFEENRAVKINTDQNTVVNEPYNFIWSSGGTTPLRPRPIITPNEIFSSWPVRNVEDGYGKTERQTYSLNIRTEHENFIRLRDQYLKDPSVLNNNDLATYYPFATGNRLAVGDHMYINIWGPLNGVVRFTNIEFTDTRFLIEGVTLEPPFGNITYNHPDAGIIRFRGQYDFDSGFADIEIENVTKLGNWMTYISGPSSLGLNIGRSEQRQQWRTVIDNIENFIQGDNPSRWQSIETLDENGETTSSDNFEF